MTKKEAAAKATEPSQVKYYLPKMIKLYSTDKKCAVAQGDGHIPLNHRANQLKQYARLRMAECLSSAPGVPPAFRRFLSWGISYFSSMHFFKFYSAKVK